MNDHSASLYDLSQARQFLDLLYRRPGAAPPGPSPVSAPVYARLAGVAPPFPAFDNREAGRDTGAVAEREMPVRAMASWEDFLAWCAPLARAEAAFVVDSQGFIIATRGPVPEEGFDGAGAEMICSVEQLQRIAPDAGEVACIDIDFDKRRIVGFVTTAGETVQYAVVLVAPGSFSQELKAGVIRQLLHNLPDLE